MSIVLKVEKREVSKKDGVRVEGVVPAVVYGPKQEAVALTVNQKEFDKVFKESGESTIITLEGLEETVEVLVKSVDYHPTKPGVLHVDFYAIERGKEMTTEIPLTFIGVSPIEKRGGMVNKVLHEITVTCRPSNLPKEIVVDISTLTEADQQILVSSLTVPDGVQIDTDGEEVVAVAQGARSTTEDEDQDTESQVDISAIEVEKKGKEEAAE